MSDSLRPHGLQHTRLPCPSLSPGACSNSCPLSRWCHPTILSSVVPFSSCVQSFPASGSFLMSQLFPSGGQRIGASAWESVLPMNEYSRLISFKMDWLDLLVVQLTLKSFLNSSVLSFLYSPTLTFIHDYWKNHRFDYTDHCCKVMSLLLKMPSRFVITFVPRSKRLLISWLQSPSAVTICSDSGAQEKKVFHCFCCFPIYLPWSDGTRFWFKFSECWVLSQSFHSSFSLLSRGSSALLCFLS